jgi:adenylosuccinate synthase
MMMSAASSHQQALSVTAIRRNNVRASTSSKNNLQCYHHGSKTTTTATTTRTIVRASSSSSSPTATEAKAASSDNEWKKLGQVCAVLGSQWGDEGKGKLVDILAREYEVVCRCQGGANAGHTIYDDDGKKYALHLVPSGILNKKALCVVGNGVVVHLPGMFEELDALEKVGVDCAGRMIVSDRAHLLFELHKEVDGLR